MNLPKGWTEIEHDIGKVVARVERHGRRYVVECAQHHRDWSATVTRVRAQDCDRLAELHGHTLFQTVQLADLRI